MPTSPDLFRSPPGRHRPNVIAHRGLSAQFPENTLPAYEAAIATGADLVELDFYNSADGTLFCMHDAVLNRYLAPSAPAHFANRPVGAFTISELQSLDVGAWKAPRFAGTRIPTLAEVLALFLPSDRPAGPTLVLEHKQGTPEQLLTLLERDHAIQKVIAQSFNWDFVRALHRLEPRLALAALGGKPLTDGVLRDIPTTGARALHWDQHAITSDAVRRAHALGLKVWTYTLNTEMAFRGARLMQLDAITTDHCDRALAIYREDASPR